MSVDLNNYAFSFSHAILRIADAQYTGVRTVSVSQDLQEAAVYGTDIRPLKRSTGQLQMGRGQIVFSDYEEGINFFQGLGAAPLQRIFELNYTLEREDGVTKSIVCQGCRLTGFGIEHQAGPDALNVTYPFSFLSMKVEGSELLLPSIIKSIGDIIGGVSQISGAAKTISKLF